jgi:DnaB-like helicase N terminal domain/Protein of unknown function (DUF3987)
MFNNEDGYPNGPRPRGVPLYGARPEFRAPADDSKIPMHIESEQAALVAILVDEEDAMTDKIMAILSPEDFFRQDHELIFRVMKRMYDAGKPINLVTLEAELGAGGYKEAGGDEYFAEIIERFEMMAHSGNYYAEIVKQKAINRAAIKASEETARDVHSHQFTAEQIVERAAARIQSIESHAARADDDDDLELDVIPKMGAEAFDGIAGDIVHCITPETEACGEAILMQFLVAIGNLFGVGPHAYVGATMHRCNLYMCLVGPTGCGKGMAWDAVEWQLGRTSEEFTAKPFLTGMTSGEGVIMEAKELSGPVLAVETEFARTITNMNRDGNSLNAILRQAFESTRLRIPTKNNPIIVEGSHLSLIAHVPPSELKGKLSPGDIENGLVNRFLWARAYLGRLQSNGGCFENVQRSLAPYFEPLIFAVDFAKALKHPYRRDRDAQALWDEVYGPLRVRPPGPHGSATARAAALTLRLSMIFAVLERDHEIRLHHLKSALAVWDYCDQTAKSIFGDGRTDRNMVKLIKAMEQAVNGLSRSEISRKVFGGHVPKDELTRLLDAARSSGQLVYADQAIACTKRRVWIDRRYSEHANFAHLLPKDK